jgi:hypothetical protein
MLSDWHHVMQLYTLTQVSPTDSCLTEYQLTQKCETVVVVACVSARLHSALPAQLNCDMLVKVHHYMLFNTPPCITVTSICYQ